jgi:hypothetical protein
MQCTNFVSGRLSIFIPLVDDVLGDIESRFNSKCFQNLYINELLSSNLNTKNMDDLKVLSFNIAEVLEPFCEENVQIISAKLLSELELWQNKSHGTADVFDSHEDFFPLIKKASMIYTAIPNSVATSERSFSTLRHLKSWLRSTMRQERLVGLALLHIHRDVKVSVNKVIDNFAKSGKRCLDFVL